MLAWVIRRWSFLEVVFGWVGSAPMEQTGNMRRGREIV